MAVTLNASTSSGFIATSDTSGSLELQANGTTKATVSSTGLSIGQYTPAASLITSGTAVASTSGTSIDFTSIPSWVKRVTVMFNGVSTNGNSNLLVQIGTSGGIQNTGYTSGAWDNNTSTASSTAGFLVRAANNFGYANDGLLTICLSDLSSGAWVGSSVITSGASLANAIGAGKKTLSGTLDRVRITTVNGTDAFDAGTINILYE